MKFGRNVLPIDSQLTPLFQDGGHDVISCRKNVTTWRVNMKCLSMHAFAVAFCKFLIYSTLICVDLQEVAMNCYSCDEYTTIEHNPCVTTPSDTSAVMFLYDSIDKCSKDCENFHRDRRHSYSIIIMTVLVKSASVCIRDFARSVKQLADGLSDEVIANGVIVNVGRFFITIITNLLCVF